MAIPPPERNGPSVVFFNLFMGVIFVYVVVRWLLHLAGV